VDRFGSEPGEFDLEGITGTNDVTPCAKVVGTFCCQSRRYFDFPVKVKRNSDRWYGPQVLTVRLSNTCMYVVLLRWSAPLGYAVMYTYVVAVCTTPCADKISCRRQGVGSAHVGLVSDRRCVLMS
jgi:hypothetical protein